MHLDFSTIRMPRVRWSNRCRGAQQRALFWVQVSFSLLCSFQPKAQKPVDLVRWAGLGFLEFWTHGMRTYQRVASLQKSPQKISSWVQTLTTLKTVTLLHIHLQHSWQEELKWTYFVLLAAACQDHWRISVSPLWELDTFLIRHSFPSLLPTSVLISSPVKWNKQQHRNGVTPLWSVTFPHKLSRLEKENFSRFQSPNLFF